MGVQVIGSGGQQVTAVGVPTKRVNAAAVRIVGAGAGGAGGDHNDTTNRDAADAHPISAITGLQDALDAVAGGGSNLRVDLAIADQGSDIDLDAAAPGDVPAVLIWGRASGNGVYEASVVDGWTLLDPQPTLVVADALVQAPSLDPVLDTGVASIYDYSDTAGWQLVGSVPTLDGNPSQVWGPTGWVTPDGGASALADLTDVDVTSDPPAQDDVLAWDDTENKWTPATLDGGVALSDAAPQDLGTAAAGVSDEASRADHVHDMPTATDVGADPSGTAATAVTVHTADTTAVHGIADTSALVVTSDARLSDARTPTAHTHPAADITVDASGFNGNLTTSDDTVQEIAQKLDDLVIPAAGIADPGGANDDFLQRKSGAWTYRTVAQVKAEVGDPLGLGSFNPSGKYLIPAGGAVSAAASAWPSGHGRPYVQYLPAGTINGLGAFYTTAGASGYVAYCWIYAVDQYLRAGDLLGATSALTVGTGSNSYVYGSVGPLTVTDGLYALVLVNVGTGTGPTYRGVQPPTGSWQPFTVWNSTPDIGNAQPTLNNVTGLTGTAPAAWPNKNNGSPGGQSAGATPAVIVRYQ